jgi:hypothetical protein
VPSGTIELPLSENRPLAGAFAAVALLCLTGGSPAAESPGSQASDGARDAMILVQTDRDIRKVAQKLKSQIEFAQGALKARGYPVGRVDGKWGRRSKSAARKFQASKGLNATGLPDTQTLEALGAPTELACYWYPGLAKDQWHFNCADSCNPTPIIDATGPKGVIAQCSGRQKVLFAAP